jgi:hypothetical protein
MEIACDELGFFGTSTDWVGFKVTYLVLHIGVSTIASERDSVLHSKTARSEGMSAYRASILASRIGRPVAMLVFCVSVQGQGGDAFLVVNDPRPVAEAVRGSSSR